MKIETLHIEMQVKHPQYGVGTVKSIGQHTAEVRFNDETRALDPDESDLEPAEPQATLNGMTQPLAGLCREFAQALATEMGLEGPDTVVEELAARWHKGKIALHPSDPTLQTKEIPIEVFFHKIVMMRNNLRVLEQKINTHKELSSADKFDMHQYITRCYGSMTTFNSLFRNKEDQFSTKAG